MFANYGSGSDDERKGLPCTKSLSLFGHISYDTDPDWDLIDRVLLDESISGSTKKAAIAQKYEDKNILFWALSNYGSRVGDDLLRRLIRWADPSALHDTDRNGISVLHAAVSKHRRSKGFVSPEMLGLLVEKAGMSDGENDSGYSLLTATDKFGFTPLHRACHQDAPVSLVSRLLELSETYGRIKSSEKFDVDNDDDDDNDIRNSLLSISDKGESLPIHIACYHDASVALVSLLVEHPRYGGLWQLYARDRDGDTPLHNACKGDASIELLTYLTMQISIGGSAMAELWRSDHSLPESIIRWTLKKRGRARDAALHSTFVRSVLNHQYVRTKYLTVLMMDIWVQVVVVGLVSFGIDDVVQGVGPASTASLKLLSVCLVWIYCREFLQILTTPLSSYIFDSCNWFETVQIGFLTATLRILTNEGGVQTRSEGIVITMTSGVVWLLLVVVLGNVDFGIAVFVAAFQRTILKVIPFAVTTLIFIFSFAQMYYVSNHMPGGQCRNATAVTDEDYEDQWTCELSQSYLTSFFMLLDGEWRYIDLSAAGFNVAISCVFAVITGILLLNILIAVISDVFSEVRQQGEREFWRTRFSFLQELDKIYDTLAPNCFGCYTNNTETANTNFNYEDEAKVETNLKKMNHFQPHYRLDLEEYTIAEFFAQRDSFTDSEIVFLSWWLFSAAKYGPPDFGDRLRFFFQRCSRRHMIFPGEVMERVLQGYRNKEVHYSHKAGPMMMITLRRVMIRLALYVTYPVILPLVFMFWFLLGLVTLGLLWPKWMKQYLFFVPVVLNEENNNSSNDEREKQTKEEEYTKLQQENEDLREKVDRLKTLLVEKREPSIS